MRQTIAAAAVAAVAVLLLAACPAVEGEVGPQGPEGPPGYSPLASGTRIKARVGTTADGAKMFLGWFDAERQENCSFRTAADGKVRCLPDVFADWIATPGRRFFSDATCETLVIPSSGCVYSGECEPPALALFAPSKLVTSAGSAPIVGVYEIADLVTGGQVFELTQSGCGTGRDSAFLSISREVPASDFQAMTESLE